jgi:hypothetical protein
MGTPARATDLRGCWRVSSTAAAARAGAPRPAAGASSGGSGGREGASFGRSRGCAERQPQEEELG